MGVDPSQLPPFAGGGSPATEGGAPGVAYVPPTPGAPPADPNLAPTSDERAADNVAGDAPLAVAGDAVAEAAAEHEAAVMTEHRALVAGSPIVWGDVGERVMIAARLLANATGKTNLVAEGVAKPMWSADLADQAAAFQKEHEIDAARAGCVDAATWSALEQAAAAAASSEVQS